MNNIQLIGLLAGILTSISFLPQVIKTWKTKSADDLSLNMFLLFTTGITLWLIYGLIINDLPIILANVFTLCSSGTILYFKLRYRSQL
ncbi:MAG: SemiSWEET transporter [Bacteroidota bacterium]